MNERIYELAVQAKIQMVSEPRLQEFAELIVQECINREELLGAIARGWCSEKNKHKTMDSDLALSIFDEVEKQIKELLGVAE